MLLSAIAVLAGLALLVWSADQFVDGAAAMADHFGVPALLIGMVIVGFGTSAPEMVVSAFAAWAGNPGLALGNAYGSNIANIALILGVVAVISPIAVHSSIIRKELPVLLLLMLVAGYQLLDGELTRMDALVLGLLFTLLMGWSIYQGLRGNGDALGLEMDADIHGQQLSLGAAGLKLLGGLAILVASSRLLVWGATDIALALGVSDLIIGLTIIAIGTSLPELASSIAAVRKNQHDIALGNVIGSNVFNTLAVVGIAAGIQPLQVDSVVLYRDWAVMTLLTLLLFVMAYGFRGPGRINRLEGLLLLTIFTGYTGYLGYTIVAAS